MYITFFKHAKLENYSRVKRVKHNKHSTMISYYSIIFSNIEIYLINYKSIFLNAT